MISCRFSKAFFYPLSVLVRMLKRKYVLLFVLLKILFIDSLILFSASN